MNRKVQALDLAYQIATMTVATQEVMDLLLPLPFERSLELLLMIRQSPRPVRSPINFLRRAIAEDWQPEALPEKLNRRVQNMTELSYLRRGVEPEEAVRKAREVARGYNQ